MITPYTDNRENEIERRKVISSVKDRLTLCLWWLSIPVYTIAIQYMKTWFLPKTIFRFNIHDFLIRERSAAFFMFVILPVLLILINAFSIRDLFKLENAYPKSKPLVLIMVIVLEIIISAAVICIFFI